ncbi:helix-turn-helix transcriptional regulator [Reinekea forsetii]|nr:helix-turn-helix transcriptional regulator [Reinekea forsetii]
MKFSNKLEIGKECFEIFLTSDELPEMSLHNIHMAGIAHLKPPYVIERSQLNLHTLLFTSSGQGKLTTETTEAVIQPGTMTVLPAQTNYRFEINDDHWDMCWILLPEKLDWQTLMPDQPEIRPTSQALNIFYLCHVINQEREIEASFRDQSFHQLARYIESNLNSLTLEKDDRLSAAFRTVNQSLHKPWTVNDIAQLTYYSEPHLYRLCKERFGKSPKQIIRSLRIDRAKQLLTLTDWPLNELAQRVGFSDAFNFSNRFKKEVGLSPSRFREVGSNDSTNNT